MPFTRKSIRKLKIKYKNHMDNLKSS